MRSIARTLPRTVTRALAVSLAVCLAVPALAQVGEAQPAPADAPTAPTAPPVFEPQLVRLMEVLGSVEVLRGVCGGETGEWRQRAQALIDAEGESDALRRRMIAGYNRGNRAFAAYRTCTASAVFAIERYMDEGETLSRDLIVRYGE